MSEPEVVQYKPVSAELRECRLGSTSRQLAVSGIAGYITEAEFAGQLDLKVSTVRRWRSRGYGPKSVKIGRRFYYLEDAAERWLAAALAKAEAAASPRGRGRQRQAEI